ncbi:S9 family peptidase [Natronospira bacteriovora]|uniref:Acyl-peptide hydrolase n=1 Tax=Natronospira bacteriovora TaxID=3069753 RepID=A0ABU0W9W3_9GAMM|nr:S9 family peptidase [Natronospira sp. AB-CW4]MDQ2070703.1 S9 family peptidase [Natronospira sp. AB-CW4]
MKRVALLFLLTLLFAGCATAGDYRPLSKEVLWDLDRLGSPLISPNGEHIVVPRTRFDVDTDESETRLWLLDREEGVKRPLTKAGNSVSQAVFSPDSRKLAFISARDDDKAGQIYILPMDGPGEATRLTDIPTGVSAPKWVGDHLYFITRIWPGKGWDEMKEKIEEERQSHVSAHEWTELPYSHFDHWLDESRQAHLYRIPAEGGDVEAITYKAGIELPRSTQGTGTYDVAPDESLVAFVSDSIQDGVAPKNDIFLIEPGSDRARNITEGNRAPDGNPLFSPDGRTLAFTQQRILGFYADTRRLVLHDLESGEQTVVTEDWDRSADGLVWAPDASGLYGAIDDAGTRRVWFIPVNGDAPRPITGETSFSGLSIAEDGSLVAANESFLHPAQIVLVDTETGETRRLEDINDDILAEVDLGTYESVTYEGYDGQEIQMWVHYPPGFDRSREYPLFLLIHGGPHSGITDGFHFRWNAQTFASWGYVTAWHNFHGSSGFGQEFTDSINPDWITRPYTDTIKAAEWFKEQPWIDSDRMAAGGGSYGGYLSSILLGRDHPFNALVIHAAVYNLYSQMSADFAVHSVRFGDYWDDPSIYRELSPHYYAESFDTPSLVIHGQLDYRVPVGQGFELFRTLQHRGVDSKMVYYPDENHWILKPNNSIHWYESVRDWISRYAEPGAR